MSINIEDKQIEGSIVVRSHKENPEWVEVYSTSDGESLAFPKDLIDDVVDALMLHRGDR